MVKLRHKSCRSVMIPISFYSVLISNSNILILLSTCFFVCTMYMYVFLSTQRSDNVLKFVIQCELLHVLSRQTTLFAHSNHLLLKRHARFDLNNPYCRHSSPRRSVSDWLLLVCGYSKPGNKKSETPPTRTSVELCHQYRFC